MPSRPDSRSNLSFFSPHPDPLGAVNDKDAYEYVGPDTFPDPPRSTFDDDDAADHHHSSRRSHRPRHQSRRASTQPPESSRRSSPPMSRRAESPPPRSSRYADEGSPRSRPHKYDAEKPGNNDKWANMKIYGRKGLNKLGNLASSYAATQAASSGRGKSTDRQRSRSRDSYDDRRSHRRSRRYSPSPSPSPSPPPRRGAARHSRRDRPQMNGRHKSYSVSPAPLSRDPDDYGRGRGHGGRRPQRRRHRSPSYSDSDSSLDSRSTRRRDHRRGRSEGDLNNHKKQRRGPSSRRKGDGHRDDLRAPKPDVAVRWQTAARAALEAGGVTAFRLRKQPGTWGEKLPKVATAALGAAAMDAFLDKDPRRQRSGGTSGIKGMAESAIIGMITSKFMGVKSSSTHRGTPRYI